MCEVAKRLAIGCCVAAFFLLGYFAVGFAASPSRAHSLSTPLDGKIPFIAASVWIYLWSYTAALNPLFFIRSFRLFCATSIGYVTVIALSLVVFVAYPVTSLDLRVHPTPTKFTNLSEWLVFVVYALDPPYNLFPSLHVSLCTLSSFALWKAHRVYGSISFIGLVLVAISVCTTKQHFVVDSLAGLLLGASAGLIVIGNCKTDNPTREVLIAGPVLYLVVLIILVSSIHLAFYEGFAQTRYK